MDFPRLLIVLAFFIILMGILVVSAIIGYADAAGWGSDDNHKYCKWIVYNTETNQTQKVLMPCTRNA
jgi:hypothetical protein